MKTFKQLLETLLRPGAFGERLREKGKSEEEIKAGIKLRRQRMKAIKRKEKELRFDGGIEDMDDDTAEAQYVRLGKLRDRFNKNPGRDSERAAPPDTSLPPEESRLERARRLNSDYAYTKLKKAEDKLNKARRKHRKADDIYLDTTFAHTKNYRDSLLPQQTWQRRFTASRLKRKGAIPPGTLFMNFE